MKTRGWLYFFFLSLLETVEAANFDQCLDPADNGCNEPSGNSCSDLNDDDGTDYSCVCSDVNGWAGDTTQFCTDIDECSLDDGTNDICGDMSQITCTNTLGSYTCTCSTAGHVVISGSNGVFTTSTVGSLVCGDVDECATNNHECCADNCSCNNEAPGYTCSCNTGYVADGLYNCVDENECDTPNKCGSDANSICTNTDGSYLCECNDPGFTFNTGGQTCDNIDECTDNTHNCCTHTGCSACVDDDPGFTCGCDAGYTGDGTSCADVDECDDGSHDCGDTAGAMSCVNNVGTFDCVCDSGYTFENNAGVKSCVQIDECDDGSHECCAVGCICSDLPGSYECTCDSGYE
ncbi:unnamed protein product, partial [Oikopleura dioica]